MQATSEGRHIDNSPVFARLDNLIRSAGYPTLLAFARAARIDPVRWANLRYNRTHFRAGEALRVVRALERAAVPQEVERTELFAGVPLIPARYERLGRPRRGGRDDPPPAHRAATARTAADPAIKDAAPSA